MGITQQKKLILDQCLGKSFYHWVSCEAHYWVNPIHGEHAGCSECPPSAPSRPKQSDSVAENGWSAASGNSCVSCGDAMYFSTIQMDCVLIPVLVRWNGAWQLGVSNLDRKPYNQVRYVTLTSDELHYNSNTRFGGFRYDDNQLELKHIQAHEYFDSTLQREVECANEQDHVNYRFRDACGSIASGELVEVPTEAERALSGNSPAEQARDETAVMASKLWLKRDGSEELTSMADADSDPTTVYEVVWKGKITPCGACAEGTYHSECWAHENAINENGEACRTCTTFCGSDVGHETALYLSHPIQHSGCDSPNAVDNTICVKCDQVATDEESFLDHRYGIVIGCGFQSMHRWPNAAQAAIATTCPVVEDSTGAALYDESDSNCVHNLLRLQQTNDFRGRTARAPHSIPYCPPGHFIDLHPDSRNEGCPADDAWKTVWNIHCCRKCERCASHQMKSATWKACAGNTIKDTQLTLCADKCSTGFWQQKEASTGADSDTTCVQCRVNCNDT